MRRISIVNYFSHADSDDIDTELDRYRDYEDQFAENARVSQRKNPKHKPKKTEAAQLNSIAEVDGLEGGFKTTYKPGLFEEGWLLNSLRPFYDMGLMTDVVSRVKGGKEANVYCVQGSPNLDNALVAAKVYRPQMFRSIKNDSAYREGRNTLNSEGSVVKKSDNRIMRALGKKSAFGMEVAHTSWLMHEFGTMKSLHALGAAVPRPIQASPNAILMEYCGDGTLGAPTLAEIRLDEEQAYAAFDTVLQTVEIMLRLGLVHGDLSAYNILYWDEQATVIDFPQVIEVDGNPNARDFLRRDLTRLCQYFGACGDVRDPETLLEALWLDRR